MATTTHSPTGETGPSFKEILDDNAPYIVAMYLLNGVLFALFVDHGALAQGRVEYATLFPAADGAGVVTQVAAAGFALGFAVATVVALVYAASVLRAQSEDVDPYALEERISTVTVMPAVQLLAVILSPVLTGHGVAEGLTFVPEIVALFL
jgi:hypothetical protein